MVKEMVTNEVSISLKATDTLQDLGKRGTLVVSNQAYTWGDITIPGIPFGLGTQSEELGVGFLPILFKPDSKGDADE